jgi:hypothetical protein
MGSRRRRPPARTPDRPDAPESLYVTYAVARARANLSEFRDWRDRRSADVRAQALLWSWLLRKPEVLMRWVRVADSRRARQAKAWEADHGDGEHAQRKQLQDAVLESLTPKSRWPVIRVGEVARDEAYAVAATKQILEKARSLAEEVWSVRRKLLSLTRTHPEIAYSEGLSSGLPLILGSEDGLRALLPRKGRYRLPGGSGRRRAPWRTTAAEALRNCGLTHDQRRDLLWAWSLVPIPKDERWMMMDR